MFELRNYSNNGKYHVFLGHPMSSGIDKTVVEPGNAFSPGLWTLGVSLAVKSGSKIVSPETCELPLDFKDGRPPITVCAYDAGAAHVRSELCHIGGAGWHGVTYFRAEVTGEAEDACLIIRDIGPAGGRIDSLEWSADEHTLCANACIRFVFETDISHVDILPADAAYDSPAAFVHFAHVVKVAVYHGYAGRAFSGPVTGEPVIRRVDDAFIYAQADWDRQVPAKLLAPDERIGRMWEQCAYHMIAAMECGLPRIGVANYPVFWIRDCVIVLRALDLIGRSDLARIGCDYLKPLLFSGGFGAESDNPGEGVWALVSHALVTHDIDWLRGALPAIIERTEWIERMLNAEEVIHRAGDSRTMFGLYCPGSSVVCLPHEGRHIHGRMDWHSPDFYINCWAYTGLNLAAKAAELLGETVLFSKWTDEAASLDEAIAAELLPVYGNERDSCALPYPCGALSGAQEPLKEAFIKWYRANRLDDAGNRVPEKLWTYFEAAQIHNAVLLGFRDEAWACLDGFLSDPRWQNMSVFLEGTWNATEMLPFGNGRYGRGWLQKGATGANMPHNWTMSETTLMLRSLLVTEAGNELSLLRGVPDTWLKPGAEFGVKDMPTHWGEISFTATVIEDKKLHLEITKGQDIPYRIGRSDLEVSI